jgi:hypothetical protein
MKSHVFCGKTFNLPLSPITHVSRLFALWLMALHVLVHRNMYFPSRKLDVSIFRGVLNDRLPGKNSFLARITGGNMPLFFRFYLLLVDLQAIQDRTGQESQLIYEYA